jgi:hypothetical protein
MPIGSNKPNELRNKSRFCFRFRFESSLTGKIWCGIRIGSKKPHELRNKFRFCFRFRFRFRFESSLTTKIRCG